MDMIHKNYWNEYLSLSVDEDDEEPFQMGGFGRSATYYLLHSDAFINLAVGSIRSGKTIVAIVTFLRFIESSPHTSFAMAGKTLKSLYRNVIKPMKAIMKFLGVKYYHHKFDAEIEILNLGGKAKTITLYGIEKKGSEEHIKGSSYAGALLDEVTAMDEDGVHMMVSRCSMSGARIFMTCNPSNPHNFVYTKYIQSVTADDDDIQVTQFLIDDNKNLSQSYIKHLKGLHPPESVFYKRNILGQWVSGEGIIYSRFDDNNIYDERKPLDYYDYVDIGSDYGSSSTTCWTVTGVKEYDDHNEFDVFYEDGHDALKRGYSVTDSEIVRMILETQNTHSLDRDNVFYVSHDATSLKIALEQCDEIRMTIDKYTPDLMHSIESINSLFYHNHLRVHRSCTDLIHSIQSYEWDSNAARKGVDKPLKQDDHYVDAMRAPIMNHLFEDGRKRLGGMVSI